MKRRRGLVALVVVTTGALLVTLPPGVTGAQTQDDLEQAEEEAADALDHATAREREAAEKYAEATEALPKAEARLEAARERVGDAGAVIEAAAEEEQSAEEALALATLHYEGLQREVERSRERISTLATAAYKSSGMYTVSAVLSASGPEDLVRQLGVVGRVAANERDAMRELTVAQASADAARDEADAAHQRAEDARVAAQKALESAEDAKREAEDAADEVTALVDARAEALAAAEEEREKAEAELAQVEDDLREWEEANLDGAPVLESGAQLLMPVEGTKTSDYGTRTDPITGEDRLHAGVDFAAPAGTPIWAAAAGTVIQAGWSSGYGNFTCVSHGTYEGQGMSTCYAHQSEIQVSAGEAVDAGETIGLVGTTGNSTGNHLHFEVRLDGSPVDPLPWLPDCLC